MNRVPYVTYGTPLYSRHWIWIKKVPLTSSSLRGYTVNELLKDQIAQMHAFSQVRPFPWFLVRVPPKPSHINSTPRVKCANYFRE